jgi:hypothetical protein
MLLIKIEPASDGGYMYDFYTDETAIANGDDSIDGGQCTSENMKDALDMAHDHATRLIETVDFN